MLNSKTYLGVLFLLVALVFSSAVGYVLSYKTEYPLPFTSRISLDAKIQFVREHIDVKKIDTIILGSSLGLNNVYGEYLEKTSTKCSHVLNLSVYEASSLQAEQLMMFRKIFPNLKRIIYSTQFTDFQHLAQYKNFDSDILGKYMANTLNPLSVSKLIFDASKDLPFLEKRKKIWKSKHIQNNKYSYLGFDHTGSVPLNIYGKDIIKSRWKKPHGSRHLEKAFQALDRMSKDAAAEGLYFYIVQQPYRRPMVKKYKHIRAELNWFLDKVTRIVHQNSGYVLSLYRDYSMSDAHFADRTHLNNQGSKRAAEVIGKFIDKTEK